MIVTSYYDIYNNPDSVVTYLTLFTDLGNSGIPIILFTESHLESHFKEFPCVTVVCVPLEQFELYRIGCNYNGELPSNRNATKDTKEFLSLMNTKIEFIKKAAERTEDDTFLWVDFGILKIVKNREQFISKLKSINERKFTNISIPGCWVNSSFSVNTVNWRFCGGFLVIPRHHIDTFYNHSKNVLTDFCTLPQYKLTWETNIWYVIEYCVGKDIEWYLADHNDSIINL